MAAVVMLVQQATLISTVQIGSVASKWIFAFICPVFLIMHSYVFSDVSAAHPPAIYSNKVPPIAVRVVNRVLILGRAGVELTLLVETPTASFHQQVVTVDVLADQI